MKKLFYIIMFLSIAIVADARLQIPKKSPQFYGDFGSGNVTTEGNISADNLTLTGSVAQITFDNATAVINGFGTSLSLQDGAVIIDVGVNRVDDPTRERGYRLVGDVDFDACARKASAITPVPGGVGPMTIAMLMSNTVTAAEKLAN